MYQAQRYFRALELNKVLEKLSEQANCDDSKQMALSLTPLEDYAQVKALMQKTADAYMLSARYTSPALHKLKNCEAALKKAEKGSNLSLRELLDVSAVLHNIRSVKDWRKRCEGESTSLDVLFELLMPNRELENTIDNAILSEEELADSASRELGDLRRKINQAKLRVREKLDAIIKSPTQSKYLQETLVTMRDGRFVVPVKSEHRSEIKGLVHDTSASGATIFIEPMAVVEANNEIRVLQAKEKREIERIIAELSVMVGSFAEPIIQSYRALVEIDLYFAKASLAYKMKATVPNIVDSGEIDLKRARHPLIDPEKVVPTDVNLGKDFNTLVITGPNTGGKTVTLKTLGLLTLMAMCGLMLPVAENSTISVYKKVLVDIGDEQSIEQSLSTFSGHMKKITGILELAMPHTLVLLDELGAGTDPAEGAALAVAIIEELRRRGVLLMATTHYAELKVFALETKGVVNASCEFDLETLRPTYKLSVGVPGKSNAFLISEKLGIPERVIEAAQQHLSAEDKRLDAVLGQLDDLKLQLKESQDEVEELKNEASHQLEAAQKKRDELIQQGENELEAARAKARALAQQVESKAYALTDELRQLQKDERLSTQQKAQRAREIAKKESEKLFIGTEVVHNPVKEFVPLKEVKVGQEVCIAELNQLATVLALPDKNGDVLVRAGIIKTKVPLKGLKQPDKLIKEPQPKTKAQQRYSRLTGDANRPNGRVERVQRSAKMELNLLGLTVDEALPEVDAYIDRAILNGQTVVYLIHGNGTGALRTAIHKHLRGNRMVKSFRLGRYGEGESGVTVVELK